MDRVKAVFVAVFTALSARLGILAIPVYLLVMVNVIDYGTGIFASQKRGETISSSVGFNGIVKKICMWLLVGIGAIIDMLLTYGAERTGISLNLGFAVACLAAVWLICNELISILENMVDIGVDLPPFLLQLVKSLKSQVETKAEAALPKKTDKT